MDLNCRRPVFVLESAPGDTPPVLRLRAFIVLAGLSACSAPLLGGLKVQVRFLDTDARCAKVFVTGTNNLIQTSDPLVRGSRDRIVGIAQDEYSGPAINLQAKGYLAGDCSGMPIDTSKLEHREFLPGDVSATVLLVLKGGATPDAGSGDAGIRTDAGTDAGMDAGTVDAGPMPEICGNTLDDDQDG